MPEQAWLRSGTGWAAVVPGRRPGAAVADRVPVFISYRHAPGRAGVAGGGADQIPGQLGVDKANSVHLAGLAPRYSPWPLQTTRGYPGSRH
jgi:hypothetical protein